MINRAVSLILDDQQKFERPRHTDLQGPHTARDVFASANLDGAVMADLSEVNAHDALALCSGSAKKSASVSLMPAFLALSIQGWMRS